MKKIILLPLIFILLLSACGGKKVFDPLELKDGDIIFQISEGERSPLFWILNKSPYTRIGVVTIIRGKTYVIGVSDLVRFIPFQEWLDKGGKDKFVVKRLKDDEPLTEENINAFRQDNRHLVGKPYDKFYRWNDKSMYPAELVWKIFKKSLKVELAPLHSLDDLLVNYDNAREELSEVPGYTMNLKEKMITIQELFNSELLEVFYSPDEF